MSDKGAAAIFFFAFLVFGCIASGLLFSIDVDNFQWYDCLKMPLIAAITMGAAFSLLLSIEFF